jgi:hypothetical protein
LERGIARLLAAAEKFAVLIQYLQQAGLCGANIWFSLRGMRRFPEVQVNFISI